MINYEIGPMESASATSSLALSSLRHLLARQPLTPAKAVFAWRLVAGPAMGRAAAASFADGRLLLRVASPAWRREIDRAAPFLKERLADLLGQHVVRWIDVTELTEDSHA
jgi:hypothetical protein